MPYANFEELVRKCRTTEYSSSGFFHTSRVENVQVQIELNTLRTSNPERGMSGLATVRMGEK